MKNNPNNLPEEADPYEISRPNLRLFCILFCLMLGYSTLERYDFYTRLESARTQERNLVNQRLDISGRVSASSSSCISEKTNSYCPIKK